MSSGPQYRIDGWGESSTRPAATRRQAGQLSRGPSGVEDQSLPRMSALIALWAGSHGAPPAEAGSLAKLSCTGALLRSRPSAVPGDQSNAEREFREMPRST